MIEEFNDLTPMPFGKHKGTVLQDVPVTYLHWFWHNAEMNNDNAWALKAYIKKSLSALKAENKDLIWDA